MIFSKINFKRYCLMKLFHISHTDLDGYGCQLITKEFLKMDIFIMQIMD